MAPLREKQVRRLDVAVNDAARVHGREPLARLDDDFRGLLEREPPPRAELLLQVAPGEVLHHQVRAFVGEGAVVEHPHDVLALHRDERAGLALEPGEGVLAVHVLGPYELDRDPLPDDLVRRGDDEAHRAATEHALDDVLVRHDSPWDHLRRFGYPRPPIAGHRDPA